MAGHGEVLRDASGNILLRAADLCRPRVAAVVAGIRHVQEQQWSAHFLGKAFPQLQRRSFVSLAFADRMPSLGAPQAPPRTSVLRFADKPACALKEAVVSEAGAARVDADQCPGCGKPAGCGMARGDDTCWCFDLPHRLPMPTHESDARCYCRVCLERHIANQATCAKT